MFPGAMGIGMAMTVTSDTILAAIPKERAGAASAISETATELGGAVGMAVLGSVLTAVYRNDLELPAGLPTAAQRGVRDSLGSALDTARTLPGQLGAQVTDLARHAFVDGMHIALYCSASLALITGLTALVTRAERPQGHPGARRAGRQRSTVPRRTRQVLAHLLAGPDFEYAVLTMSGHVERASTRSDI
jgi:DHA2 family multidrug resistance protein-like MFS transporter